MKQFPLIEISDVLRRHYIDFLLKVKEIKTNIIGILYNALGIIAAGNENNEAYMFIFMVYEMPNSFTS